MAKELSKRAAAQADRCNVNEADHNPDALLGSVLARGFDKSYASDTGGVRVRCSQCEALVINGCACHEAGCPNTVREDDGDEGWGGDEE